MVGICKQEAVWIASEASEPTVTPQEGPGLPIITSSTSTSDLPSAVSETSPESVPPSTGIPNLDDRNTFRDSTPTDQSDEEDDEKNIEDEVLDLSLEPFALSEVLRPGASSTLTASTKDSSVNNSEEIFLSNSVDQDLVAALLEFGIDSDEDKVENDPGTLTPLQVLAEKDSQNKKESDDSAKDNNNIQEDEQSPKVRLEDISSSPLPDLELDFGGDTFLIDPDQLENVFDPQLAGEQPISNDFEEDSFGDIGPELAQLIDDLDPTIFGDQDTEDLYKELASLSLGPTSAETTPATDISTPTTESTRSIPPPPISSALDRQSLVNDYLTMENSHELPPYMVCQPCDPSSLATISEDELRTLGPATNPDSNYLVQASHELEALMQEDPAAASALLGLDEDELFMQTKAIPSVQEVLRQATDPFVKAFGLIPNADDKDSEKNKDTTKKAAEPKAAERACYGHRETIFGVTFSECGRFCATASQDSTIGIWEVATNRLLARIGDQGHHSKMYECLRVAWASPRWSSAQRKKSGKSVEDDLSGELVASSGADGIVNIWACSDPLAPGAKWTCVCTLDHAAFSTRQEKDSKEIGDACDEKEDEGGAGKPVDDKPQVYALQFIDHWQAFTTGVDGPPNQNSFLMTSSDNLVHFWELTRTKPKEIVELIGKDKIRMAPDTMSLKEVMSLHFGDVHHYGFGVTVCGVSDDALDLPRPPKETIHEEGEPKTDSAGFGGERNPEKKIFVFDADYCSSNGLLGAALSDGSLRLVNGRGICISIVQLPGVKSHLTSFCWDSTGTRLATSVATGHLVTWDVDLRDVQGDGHIVASCMGIMEGGHAAGRPLFGSRYCGQGDNLLLSWGVDGQLCLWDSYVAGNVYAPLAILRTDDKYPVYAVEFSKNTIAVAGGSDGGFIGVPFYLYTLGEEVAPDVEKATKRMIESFATHSIDKRPKIEELST